MSQIKMVDIYTEYRKKAKASIFLEAYVYFV